MDQWRKLNGQQLELPIVEEVEKVIIREKKAGFQLKICVGTDSLVKGDVVQYATVVVFLRKGKGGFMFIKSSKEQSQVALKQRMMNEVAKSIDIAYRLSSVIQKHDIDLEVHADINTDPEFKSNSALKDAMGYILGMGFVFKAKPSAFASSSCADKVL